MIGDVPQGHTEDLFCEKTFCASKSEGQVSALRFQWVWQTCWNCSTMIGDVPQGHTEDFLKFCVKTFCARFRSQIPMVWELFHNDRWCTARAHRRFFFGEKTLCASMSEGQVSALRFHRHKTPSYFTYSQIPIGLTTLLALFHDYRWGTCKGIQKIYFVKKEKKKRLSICTTHLFQMNQGLRQRQLGGLKQAAPGSQQMQSLRRWAGADGHYTGLAGLQGQGWGWNS